MRSRDAYTNALVKAVLDLYEKGIRDPSVSEIAAEAFSKPAPKDPLDQPPELGGEIYDGVAKRLGKVRLELEEVEGRLSGTINARYYQLDLRHNDHITSGLAAIALPVASNRAVGIRLVIEGEEDAVYLEWQRANGKPAATRIGRASNALDKAHQIGVVKTQDGVAALEDFSDRVGASVKDRIAMIKSRKKDAA